MKFFDSIGIYVYELSFAQFGCRQNYGNFLCYQSFRRLFGNDILV